MSVVGYDNKGEANQPSPAIWGDCRGQIINDKGLGTYRHVDFLGAGGGTLAAVLDVTTLQFGDALNLIGDTDLVDAVVSSKAGEIGGYLDLQTGASDNDGIGLQSEPFCRIVANSGKKVWLEAFFELGALVTESGFFLGLVEEAHQTVDFIVTDVASLIATDSFVGGEILPANSDAINIVKQKDGGTKANVLLIANQSTQIPSGDRFDIAGDVPFKFGLRFDGRDQIRYFINGVNVATETVDSTYDQANDLCFLAVLKTGSAAALSFAADWIRYAYQERY